MTKISVQVLFQWNDLKKVKVTEALVKAVTREDKEYR